jgi:hypothetical protein
MENVTFSVSTGKVPWKQRSQKEMRKGIVLIEMRGRSYHNNNYYGLTVL